MNENITPYQSTSKTTFLVLGFVLLGWGTLFSIFLISQGAWPVSIFLGLEYILIVYLVRFYFKENNIRDQIEIDTNEVLINKFKGEKLFHSSKYNTYWSRVFFKRFKNQSKLLIRESNKETEVAKFLHADLKESLYERIKKNISSYS
tara:strand:+ start:280 stop:720 length:441 start_codon:yes stop_codon:yes gene_type:complete